MNKTKKSIIKVSCIVPAYNEGKRIAKVLKVISDNNLVDEIIAINDGSADNTKKEIEKFKKVKLISYKKNQGKSHAIMLGIKEAKGKFIMFIDSDLIGLKKEDISNLIEPVISNEADVSISLRKNAPWICHKLGIDFISGERVIKREIVQDFNELKKMPGFAIESAFINKRIIENKARIKIVKWNKVESPYPAAKFGFIKGNIRLARMILVIVRQIGIYGIIWQIIKMRKLKV